MTIAKVHNINMGWVMRTSHTHACPNSNANMGEPMISIECNSFLVDTFIKAFVIHVSSFLHVDGAILLEK